MSFERQTSKSTLLRRTLIAGFAATTALTASCSVEAAPRQSDTTMCLDASLQPNTDGSTTIHTTWATSAYGPGVKEMRFTYTDSSGEQPLETIPPTLEPQTFTIPKDATIQVDIIENDGGIAQCSSAVRNNTP